MANLLLSSMLAAAVSTVPFLVGYQAAEITDAQGNVVGKVFLARYTQVYEAGLPRDERASFRDLLERVEQRYGDSGLRGRAILGKEYLELASLDRFGECAEIVLRLEHYTGVRYRVCDSPHQDLVRLVEDLTTPERVFWLITTLDPEAQERVGAIVKAALTELEEAAEDPERIAELQAETLSKIEQISEELGPEGTAYNVHGFEVNGGWEEASPSDPGEVEEILAKLWAGGSPEFSSRLAYLVCFLQGLREGKYPEVDGAFSSYYPVVLDDFDLDPDRLPFSCQLHSQQLHVVSGSVLGPLLFQFLPVPDSVAEEFCADEKWDPPEVGWSFDKRVERLRRGKGW